MPVYSNSKLRCFENCPLQFQFRYVDNFATDIESIEAFMGKRVHEALDWLYHRVLEGSIPSIEATIEAYERDWQESWHRLVHVVKKKVMPDDYRRRGARCLETYYRGNWPFDADRTLAIETEVAFALDDDTLVRGYIDRVSRGKQGELIIHDYKTSGYMPRRWEVLGDLQLAIYQMGAAERWPNAPAVHLVWHYLTFGKRITVQLNGAIDDRRRRLARRVQVAEAAIERAEFPARESKLCDWCSYRPICPAKGGEQSNHKDIVLDPEKLLRGQTPAQRAEAAGQRKLL